MRAQRPDNRLSTARAVATLNRDDTLPPNNDNTDDPPTNDTMTQADTTTTSPPPLPRARFRVIIPHPLPHTASRNALRAHNSDLINLIQQCGQQIEADFGQMQLMDLENARLRRLAFEREQKRAKKGKKDKQESSEAQHMTSTENLEKLAKNDWETAMEPVWKEAKACYKQQEKEIRDHNKKVEEQEKRERTMDKQAAVAKKKVDAESQRREALWRREMAGLAKFVTEYTEKEKSKATRRKQKSTRGQRAKEGETPKKKGARVGTRRGRGRTTIPSSTESEGEFSTLGTVSTIPPTPKPQVQPRPRPRPRPIQKKNISQAQSPAAGNTLDPSSIATASHERAEGSDVSWATPTKEFEALTTPPATPKHQASEKPSFVIAFAPLITPIPGRPLETPEREPRRILRFALEPTIFALDEEDDITPPASPTLEIQRNLHAPSTPDVVPDVVAAVQVGLSEGRRRSARLATAGPTKSPKQKAKASRGRSTRRK